jgi:gas vesicle protein
MKIRDLATLDKLDKHDLLGTFGLETKHSLAGTLAGTLGTLGVGILIGVGIGFMLAPKAGRGLREDIRERLRGVPETLNHATASGSQPEGAHRVG